MNKTVTDYILEVCKALNEQGVQYLVVGGTAVAFHGYFRWSSDPSGKLAEKYDLDIWYNPTYANYYRLLDALEKLGQDVSKFRSEKEPNPGKSFFRYESEKFTLDLLPQLKGLSKFRVSYSKKDIIRISGVEFSIINIDDLLLDKAAISRPKDQKDIKELKKRHGNELT